MTVGGTSSDSRIVVGDRRIPTVDRRPAVGGPDRSGHRRADRRRNHVAVPDELRDGRAAGRLASRRRRHAATDPSAERRVRRHEPDGLRALVREGHPAQVLLDASNDAEMLVVAAGVTAASSVCCSARSVLTALSTPPARSSSPTRRRAARSNDHRSHRVSRYTASAVAGGSDDQFLLRAARSHTHSTNGPPAGAGADLSGAFCTLSAGGADIYTFTELSCLRAV